jgi:hypothetical protein
VSHLVVRGRHLSPMFGPRPFGCAGHWAIRIPFLHGLSATRSRAASASRATGSCLATRVPTTSSRGVRSRRQRSLTGIMTKVLVPVPVFVVVVIRNIAATRAIILAPGSLVRASAPCDSAIELNVSTRGLPFDRHRVSKAAECIIAIRGRGSFCRPGREYIPRLLQLRAHCLALQFCE